MLKNAIFNGERSPLVLLNRLLTDLGLKARGWKSL